MVSETVAMMASAVARSGQPPSLRSRSAISAASRITLSALPRPVATAPSALTLNQRFTPSRCASATACAGMSDHTLTALLNVVPWACWHNDIHSARPAGVAVEYPISVASSARVIVSAVIVPPDVDGS